MIDQTRLPWLSLILTAALLAACTPNPLAAATPTLPAPAGAAPETPVETEARSIPLAGAVASPQAELSGLAWYGDYLILLPQYPQRMASQADGAILALHRGDLIAYLDGQVPGPLAPIEVPFIASGLEDDIAGFEGYEAITFAGETAFLAIESRQGLKMVGYLVKGRLAPDLSELRLEADVLRPVEAQARLANKSYEALLISGERLLAFYEANGQSQNPDPQVMVYDFLLNPQGRLPFVDLPYRLTDVTALDGQDRFWGINYFFPGEADMQAQADPLASEFGEGDTHARSEVVERLVEFQLADERVSLTGRSPIQLALLADEARNWEGIVRLEGRGFLLATDKFPQTILAFVADPNLR
jgi:hypothetical protein